MKRLVTLPFSGFYYSLHSDNLENILESEYENDRLLELVGDTINYKETMVDYSKCYVEKFSDYLGINIYFVELESPRFYNFSTDKIYVNISLSDLVDIYQKTPKHILRKKIYDTYTTKSGFISFYSNELEDWGGITEWDHNQLGTLLDAYVQSIDKGDLIIEPSLEDLFEIIAGREELNRLAKIQNYLIERENRKNP